jgi:ribosome-binding protein aMBF1 (putative translation factor)
MISPRQIKAARSLLGWSQQTLADRAILSVNAVKRMEVGRSNPKSTTLSAVKSALENGGIEFIPVAGGKGEGVRMAHGE